MKRKNKKIDKKVLLLIILIVLIIVLSIISNIIEKKEKNTQNSNGKFSNVEELFRFYGCELLEEKNSKITGFEKDYYVKMKYNTFENGESKQIFYERIILAVGKYLQKNYRIIDESKGLTIEVKQLNDVYNYIINGKDNYFQKESSKISLDQYEDDDITNLNINSTEISNVINNLWKKSNVNFGTKDSEFNRYDIYFDEGIRVRYIQDEVFNIVFTNKYLNEVVNGIKVGEDLKDVAKKIGDPTYGKIEDNIIGYKSRDVYVFFSPDEISIYKNKKNINNEEFEKILEKYVSKEITLKNFMNELTYIWPDYEEYEYNESSLYISYPEKGVRILMQSDNSLGIKICKNYVLTEKTKELIENEKITANLDENLIYTSEQNRIARELDYKYMCHSQSMINNIESQSAIYEYYFENNNLNLISKDDNIPNKTINLSADESFWYNDTILIYSQKGRGIYYYDVNNNINSVIIEGNDEFKFTKFEDGVLTYDETKQIKITN